MPRLHTLGSVWQTTWATLRELDANAIRAESEQQVTFAGFGHLELLDTLLYLLYTDVYSQDTGFASPSAVTTPGESGDLFFTYDLTPGLFTSNTPRADLLLIALDGRQPLAAETAATLEELANVSLPFLVVVLHSDMLPPTTTDEPLPYWLTTHTLTLGDPDAPGAADLLAAGVLARLPGELHLAAAHRLPGLRAVVAQDLVTSTAFSNASYALFSTFSEQFPVLHITIAATDMLVLTKNQVMLVYKLALAHGASADFQEFLREALVVVGLSYLWREMARGLAKTSPHVRVAPRVIISYAGTYAIGLAAWRWFAYGELVSSQQLKHLGNEALEKSRDLLNAVQVQFGSGNYRMPEHIRRTLSRPR